MTKKNKLRVTAQGAANENNKNVNNKIINLNKNEMKTENVKLENAINKIELNWNPILAEAKLHENKTINESAGDNINWGHKINKNPEEWITENGEIIFILLESIYKKYSDMYDELNEERSGMFKNSFSPLLTEDYPLFYRFCRDVYTSFLAMWICFKDERESLYRALYYRVVEDGIYESTITLLIDCSVLYPILSILANQADGGHENLWILENVVTKGEWEQLREF